MRCKGFAKRIANPYKEDYVSLLTPLKAPLARLLKTGESIAAGLLATFVAQHASWIHLGRNQILSGITFLGVTVLHAAHAHGWDKVIAGRVGTLVASAQSALGSTGLEVVIKELTALLDRAEAGVHVPITITSASKSAAPSEASTTTSTSAASVPATSTSTGPAAAN